MNQQIASVAAYRRLITEGEITDTLAERHAFYEGWNAFQSHRSERQEMIEAGGNARVGGVMLMALGSLLLFAVGLVWWSNPTTLAPRAIYAPPTGIALIILALLAFRRSRRQVREALANYRSRWDV